MTIKKNLWWESRLSKNLGYESTIKGKLEFSHIVSFIQKVFNIKISYFAKIKSIADPFLENTP